jgi:hypothetical protein
MKKYFILNGYLHLVTLQIIGVLTAYPTPSFLTQYMKLMKFYIFAYPKQ